MSSFELNGTYEVFGRTTSAPKQTLSEIIWNDYLCKKYFNLEMLYYSFVVFCPIISISLLIRFYVLSSRKRVVLSPQLKTHLIAWTCSLVFCLLFYSTIFWKKITPPSLQITNLVSELVRGSLQVSSTNTIPLSTTFLLLDRILSILCIGAQLHEWRRNIQIISIVALTITYLGNLAVLFWRTLIAPENSMEGCTFSCRTNNTIRDLLSVKLIISILNVICGAIFVYLYLRYAKSLKFRRERKLNHTVLLVFVTEFCCNIMPTSIYLLFSHHIFFHSIQLSSMISVCHNIDGLVTGILYWWTRSNATVVSKLVIKPIIKPQATTSSKFQTLSSHTIQFHPFFTVRNKIPQNNARKKILARAGTIEQNLPPRQNRIPRRMSTFGIVPARMQAPGTA